MVLADEFERVSEWAETTPLGKMFCRDVAWYKNQALDCLPLRIG